MLCDAGRAASLCFILIKAYVSHRVALRQQVCSQRASVTTLPPKASAKPLDSWVYLRVEGQFSRSSFWCARISSLSLLYLFSLIAPFNSISQFSRAGPLAGIHLHSVRILRGRRLVRACGRLPGQSSARYVSITSTETHKIHYKHTNVHYKHTNAVRPLQACKRGMPIRSTQSGNNHSDSVGTSSLDSSEEKPLQLLLQGVKVPA
jgi:hypothetical protein